MPKMKKGVESDRTRAADISLAKNSENMGSKCTKIVLEKKSKR